MAKKSDDNSGNIQLTGEEVAALRIIVSDWINEGLVTPPYDRPTTAVVEKLGISAPPAREPGVGVRAAAAAEAQAAAEVEPIFPPTPNLG
jgi:hypothetical protein